MDKIGQINFKKIKRISPSQFYSMKNCAYKSLLAEAFEKTPLLPVSPNSYFGTVLHKMLELIAKRDVNSEDSFNKTFDEQIKIVEDNLMQLGYQFYIPLQKNVRDFGLKKVLLKKHLRLQETTAKNDKIKFHSEKWFESKDGLIAGRIDLLIETEYEIIITDFKTGEITNDILDDSGEFSLDVKEEYKEQLKLYAYLYFENTGKMPTQLYLIDLAKQKFAVNFSLSECKAIFEEAKDLLQLTNESIKKGLFVANPSEENCKYCLYRPACSFFITQLQKECSFNDFSGSVKNVVRYLNGNVSVFLENDIKKITVTKFPYEKYEELYMSIGKRINIFNLRKEATEFVYSATKTTMIYE